MNPQILYWVSNDIVWRVGISGDINSDPRLFALYLFNDTEGAFRNVNLFFTRVITSSPIFMAFFPPDRNDNLLQQADLLFKSWFLDYAPWGGNIPESWISGKLGEYTEIKRGGSPRPIQEYLSDSGLRWLKISDVTSLSSPFVIDIKDHIIESGLRKTVLLSAGSLVLSNSATPGIPKILDVDSCIHDGWLYFPKSVFSKEFLYLYFRYIRQHLVNLSNGSVFNNLKTDILKEYPTTLPDSETLHQFDETVKPMFDRMQGCARESHMLAELRDALLPRLMSGEIDVSSITI